MKRNKWIRMAAGASALVFSLICGLPGYAQGQEEAEVPDILTQDWVGTGECETLPVLEEYQVNPLYADVVSENELLGLEAPAAYAMPRQSDYCETYQEAAEQIRDEMVGRTQTVSVYLISQTYDKSVMSDVFEYALEHTGDPVEGDYLRWQYAGWNAQASGYIQNGSYYICVVYTITYYTTADQEQQISDRLQTLLPELITDEMTDYQKIQAIYEYICGNVTYDYDHLEDTSYKLKYTAYGALINGTSVCQGYANLLYRMALMENIDCRLVPGDAAGGRHAWNIVNLGQLYYNVDSTWDAGRTSYRYFLKSDDHFTDHQRDEDWRTEEFYGNYPMSPEDYQEEPEPTPTPEPVPDPLKVAKLEADQLTANPGEEIVITAKAAGGTGSYTYKFIINDTSNNAWYKLQDFSPNDTLTWKATTPGTKRIMVDVRDSAGQQAGQNISIQVNGVVPLRAELKASAVNVKPGELVTLRAAANGGSGKYNYKFIINDKTDDKWYRLQDFKSNDTITWTATTPGTKRLMVDVMDSTGKTVGHNITITVAK